jgi:hypothetical protein
VFAVCVPAVVEFILCTENCLSSVNPILLPFRGLKILQFILRMKDLGKISQKQGLQENDILIAIR